MYSRTKRVLTLTAVVLGIGLANSAEAEAAGLRSINQRVHGCQVYEDPSNGLWWAFLHIRTPSTPQSFHQTEAWVKGLNGGWRLPAFHELRTINGSLDQLGLPQGLLDYYWTGRFGVLGCPFGNGFQNPQPARWKGSNWVIVVW